MSKMVIFDMDGLLLDSERPFRGAWLAEARRRGYALDESLYSEVVGRNTRDSREIFCGRFGNDFPFDEICAGVDAVLEESMGHLRFRLKDGVIELLDFLAGRSVPCVVATSTARAHAVARLQRVKIFSYFRDVSGGDEVARGKPEPDLFLWAAKKQGMLPADCLVLEDSEYGARAAHVAGMEVIVIPDLKEPPQDVRDFVLGVYGSLGEARLAIERWLEGKPDEAVRRS
jgi:beta-phosphoglucomutase-like phosphatase (HAD superfamily)